MRYYITSDLHLHDDDQPYLFTDAKEATFVRMVDEIRSTGATLVLAGDTLDLTGLQPPARGVSTFFRRVLPRAPARPPAPARSITDRVDAIRRRFPRFFDALRPLAKGGRLHVLAGNHDFELTTAEGSAALARTLGVPTSASLLRETFRIGDHLVAAHGHGLDPSNQTTHGVNNRGAVITQALYHAVTPALRALGVRGAAAIPAVRPEENVVLGMKHLLPAEKVQSFLVAFVELLRDNGYFGRVRSGGLWFVTHLFPGLLSPEAIHGRLAEDTGLSDDTRRAAEAVLAGARDLPGIGSPPPKMVVLGHTHERMCRDGYVNLGTWVDHVTGLLQEDLAGADLTLPVVVTDGATATQYDVQSLASAGRVDRCPAFRRHGT